MVEIFRNKDDKLVKSQNWDGNVKSSSSRRREFRGMRRTYVRRSEHEMKRNAEIGLFTKPSNFYFKQHLRVTWAIVIQRHLNPVNFSISFQIYFTKVLIKIVILNAGVINSVGLECYLDRVEVTGSNPVWPTNKIKSPAICRTFLIKHFSNYFEKKFNKK